PATGRGRAATRPRRAANRPRRAARGRTPPPARRHPSIRGRERRPPRMPTMNTRSLALCTTLLLLPASVAAAGCASGAVAAGTSELTVTEQVAEGAAVYEANCAKCHGANGEGTGKAPPLVGPTALPLDPRP